MGCDLEKAGTERTVGSLGRGSYEVHTSVVVHGSEVPGADARQAWELRRDLPV